VGGRSPAPRLPPVQSAGGTHFPNFSHPAPFSNFNFFKSLFQKKLQFGQCVNKPGPCCFSRPTHHWVGFPQARSSPRNSWGPPLHPTRLPRFASASHHFTKSPHRRPLATSPAPAPRHAWRHRRRRSSSPAATYPAYHRRRTS
jgi:hypothetical protein